MTNTTTSKNNATENTSKVAKLTYSKALDVAIASLDSTTQGEVVDKLLALQMSLAKKSKSGQSKPTKRQQENEEVLKPAILDVLRGAEVPMTSAEVAASISIIENLSTNRTAQVLKQLVDAGKVVVTFDKRKTYYSMS